MLNAQVGIMLNLAAYWHWLDVGLNSFLPLWGKAQLCSKSYQTFCAEFWLAF